MRKSLIDHAPLVPPMYLLEKDHEQVQPGTLPPTIAVVSGNRGMNINLNDVLSEVLEPLARCMPNTNEAISTEHTLNFIDQVSKKTTKEKEKKSKNMGPACVWGSRLYSGSTLIPFGGKFYHQVTGGPIGFRLTVIGVKIRMAAWLVRVKDTLNNNNIRVELSYFFVDDIRLLTDLMPQGVRWDQQTMKFTYRDAWWGGGQRSQGGGQNKQRDPQPDEHHGKGHEFHQRSRGRLCIPEDWLKD